MVNLDTGSPVVWHIQFWLQTSHPLLQNQTDNFRDTLLWKSNTLCSPISLCDHPERDRRSTRHWPCILYSTHNQDPRNTSQSCTLHGSSRTDDARPRYFIHYSNKILRKQCACSVSHNYASRTYEYLLWIYWIEYNRLDIFILTWKHTDWKKIESTWTWLV